MQTLPRVQAGVLWLPALPKYIPAAKLLSLRAVPKAFDDTPMPAWFPVPHDPETVMIVNRLLETTFTGPAMGHWKYPGLRSPFMHQRATVDFLTQNRRCFVLNDMGTGKSSSVLWATEFLRSRGEVKRTLILSPLSTLRVVWADELFQVRPDLRMAIAHGSAEKRKAAFEGDAPYVVTNHDTLRGVDPKYLASKFDHIVIDEAGIFRTWSSGSMPKRYKALMMLAYNPNVTRLWLMTGTPTPNGPLDAWSLIKLVNPSFSQSKTSFQMQTMRQITDFKWVAKPNAMEDVSRLMRPAIRFSKADVLSDLPPQVYTTREVALTPEQTHVRDKIRKERTVEFKGKEITAVNAAILLGKCLQVAAGSVLGIDEDDESAAVHLPYGPRFSELLDLIEQTQGKTIVFCSYTAPVTRLVKDLNAKGITAAAVFGKVAANKRADIYTAFQKDKDPQVIVAHPGTTAHGITLTAADLIVWFGPTFSAEWYEQANARAHRPGQKRTVTVAHLVSTPEERAVYKVLRERGEMQSTLLKLAKEMF